VPAFLQVKFRNLLTLILSHAHGQELPTSVATSLELELLEALRWRLGPFIHAVPSCPAAAHAALLHMSSSSSSTALTNPDEDPLL
jgi:hypothetical protein